MAAWGVAIGGAVALRYGFFDSSFFSGSSGEFSKAEMDAWNAKLKKDPHVKAAKADREAPRIIAAAEAKHADDERR